MFLNSITRKRGFGFTGGFWNRFGVIFVKAPVEVVSSALSEHFSTECKINLSRESLAELANEQLDQRYRYFLWQYKGHSWTVWWAFADENVAFTLAFLLNTKAIVITYRGTSDWAGVKVFHNDKFIEDYRYGFDDREPNEKIGHSFFGQKSILGHNYWDVETVQFIYYPNSPLPSTYRHLFCSSIRNLTQIKVQNILKSRFDEFGLLDRTLKFHNLYFPNCSEIPLPYYHAVEDYNSLDFAVPRTDSILLSKEIFLWNNLLPVPERVWKK